MKIEELRKIIKKREECHSEWTYGIEKCWNEEIEILLEDVDSTIEFLLNECTAEEFSWISEIIDDLAEKSQSRKLIDAYKSLIKKYPEECEKYNILGSLEFAEAALEEVDENGKK